MPGCWAHRASFTVCESVIAVVGSELVRAADMLEIGVTNINMHDCGINRNETCGGLTVREARTHFAAVSLPNTRPCPHPDRVHPMQWCIVSSPLILGFNFSNKAIVDTSGTPLQI